MRERRSDDTTPAYEMPTGVPEANGEQGVERILVHPPNGPPCHNHVGRARYALNQVERVDVHDDVKA